MTGLDLAHALIVGAGVTGRAVAESLLRRGHDVVLADDRFDAEGPQSVGRELGRDIANSSDPALLERLIGECSVVIPSPGVPRHHDAYVLADAVGRPVVSEFDLAAEWDGRPVAAITGTNGKTTVTTIVTTMLRRSGIVAVAE